MVTFLCVCERTFRIYSFSNFQVYSAVLLPTVTMLYVRSPSFITVSLQPLSNISSHFPHHSAPGNHYSVLCVYEFGFFRFTYEIIQISRTILERQCLTTMSYVNFRRTTQLSTLPIPLLNPLSWQTRKGWPLTWPRCYVWTILELKILPNSLMPQT